MTSPRLAAAAASTRRPEDVLAERLRARVRRRRQLGYTDAPVGLLELERLLDLAVPALVTP